MPELPEVEVLRLHLSRILPGRRIESVQVPCPRVARPWSEASLAKALVGAVFQQVQRRGKHLVFPLQDAPAGTPALHAHLGMTGRIVLEPAERPRPRHAAAVLGLGTHRWVLLDPRQFGRIGLGPIQGLGPEPLDDSFAIDDLARALASSRQAIKARLLDQSVVAGLGNIYANEALHLAGIRTGRPSSSLGPEEVARLHQAIRKVLGDAIRWGQSLELDFATGTDGLFYFGSHGQQRPGAHAEPDHGRWSVYDRAGQPCRRCQSIIRRITQGGRSSFECEGCQR